MKHIVMCFDGTANKFRSYDNTNVVKLYEALTPRAIGPAGGFLRPWRRTPKVTEEILEQGKDEKGTPVMPWSRNAHHRGQARVADLIIAGEIEQLLPPTEWSRNEQVAWLRRVTKHIQEPMRGRQVRWVAQQAFGDEALADLVDEKEE